MAETYERVVSIAVYLAYAYLIAGFLFSMLYAFVLVQRSDSQAVGAKLWFRLLIFPGAVMLWPVLLRHILRHKSVPDFREDQP
jgi:hypothetical protein